MTAGRGDRHDRGGRTTVTARLAVASTAPAFAATDVPPRPTGQIPTDPRAVDPRDLPEQAVFFTADLVHEGRNDNGDVFTRAELVRAWPSLIGMPVDKDHDLKVDGVVGRVYDAELVDVDGVATVRIAGYIHAGYYPDVAWKVREGLVRGVSMECFFAHADYTAAGRVLHDVRFIGIGLTRLPADKRALIDRTALRADQAAQAAAAARRRVVAVAAATAVVALHGTRAPLGGNRGSHGTRYHP
jgi:hypothetical protein